MPTLVRPRTATLRLRLDPWDRPVESELTLATRDGEVIWRGQATPGAWLLGLRMRDRCTGSSEDALWLMTRALLEAELTTHGLHRDGPADLPVDVVRGPDGTSVTTRVGVVPLVGLLGAHPLPHDGVDDDVRRASRSVPTPVGPLAAR